MTQPHLNPQSPEEISKRIKKLREAFGKTQAEMAELVGISQGAWAFNEKDPKRRISIDTSMRLCELFGVSLIGFIAATSPNCRPSLSKKCANGRHAGVGYGLQRT